MIDKAISYIYLKQKKNFSISNLKIDYSDSDDKNLSSSSGVKSSNDLPNGKPPLERILFVKDQLVRHVKHLNI